MVKGKLLAGLLAASVGVLGASAGTAGAATGGTLRVNLQSDTDFIDPALAYYTISWQFEYATCAKLLNYPDKAAPEGSQLQPEVATALPKVSSNGRTYTFTVRPGFKFSNGQAVTAKTFQYTIERTLSPKMAASSAQSFFSDIVGAQAYIDKKAQHISGVKVKGNQISFTLTKAAPDFLARIAMPFMCSVPVGTPQNPNGIQKTIPGAGPYYVKSWVPNKQLVLARNPNYKGNRPHNFDQIVYKVGVSLDASLLEVKSNKTDYPADGVPPAAYADLWNKYGPTSTAGKSGKQQFYVNPILAVRYVAMNTSRPTFQNVGLRKAVNYALDRKTILQQSGSYAGKVTDQILPPGILGFKDVNAYPTQGPDFAKAKAAAGSAANGKEVVLYTCNAGSCPNRASIIAANLAQIGMKVNILQFARSTQFQKEGQRGEPFDLADEGWQADYADPFDFINVLLDGNNIGESNNVNFAYFNDPKWNSQMDKASHMSGAQRAAAYAALDKNLTTQAAPWAARANDNERDIFSSRVGCVLFQPVYLMDLAHLCTR